MKRSILKKLIGSVAAAFVIAIAFLLFVAQTGNHEVVRTQTVQEGFVSGYGMNASYDAGPESLRATFDTQVLASEKLKVTTGPYDTRRYY